METRITPADLKSHLGFWLRTVSNQVSGQFAAKLASKGVGVAEWVALRELYSGEAAPSALADAMGMTRGAITKLAGRLIRRKWVTRHADAADGRAQFLALTAAGRALVPVLAALADRNDAEYFGFLSKADRAALQRILKEIASHHALKTLPTH